MQSITLLLLSGLLCLALGEVIKTPRNSIIQVETPCEKQEGYCEVVMQNITRILKKGDSFINPEDPCEEYKCIDRDTVNIDIVICEHFDKCEDKKAPYLLPGECCPTCMYLNHFKFGNGPIDDMRTNGTTEDKRPKPNTWSAWTLWTRCSRDCGGGRQSRMRDCKTEGAASLDCTGDVVEIQDCNEQPCPIHGGWSQWSEWTDCTVSCSNGTTTRSRSCTRPAPEHGGKDCEGETEQIKPCFLRHCPVPCVWLPWTQWGDCSKECGSGSQSRSRDQLVEKWGGAKCLGEGMESRLCNTHNCPIDGLWTAWSEWTACSTTCAAGTQGRSRSCSNPPPQYGGLDCEGVTEENRPCFERHCPINCAWLPFSDWSSCSKSCDAGTQIRTREFLLARFGGEECEGDVTEVELCNTQDCPDPCIDIGHPCFNEEVTCKKITDTEFECGTCPRGM